MTNRCKPTTARSSGDTPDIRAASSGNASPSRSEHPASLSCASGTYRRSNWSRFTVGTSVAIPAQLPRR